METCLLQYFVFNNELKDTCDFNLGILNQGHGIYEVFRVINGIPLFLEEHIQRFYYSAKCEQFSTPIQEKQLRSVLRKLIEINNLKNGNIRFQYVIPQSLKPLFMAWVVPIIYPSKSEFERGVEIATLNASRERPGSKRTNLPVRRMAEEIIEEDQVTEVLLINSDGLVTECHRSNIFFVADDTLLTSKVELVLPGITRHKIIDLAKADGITISEPDIQITDLPAYDASFLSSTSKSVLPVREIDKIVYAAENKITSRLALLYDQLVTEHLAGFSWD